MVGLRRQSQHGEHGAQAGQHRGVHETLSVAHGLIVGPCWVPVLRFRFAQNGPDIPAPSRANRNRNTGTSVGTSVLDWFPNREYRRRERNAGRQA